MFAAVGPFNRAQNTPTPRDRPRPQAFGLQNKTQPHKITEARAITHMHRA